MPLDKPLDLDFSLEEFNASSAGSNQTDPKEMSPNQQMAVYRAQYHEVVIENIKLKKELQASKKQMLELEKKLAINERER